MLKGLAGVMMGVGFTMAMFGFLADAYAQGAADANAYAMQHGCDGRDTAFISTLPGVLGHLTGGK